MDSTDKIPVILLGPGGSSAFRVFNPNEWSGRSKQVVQSCAAELSCLHFGQMLIEKICRYPVGRCRPHLDTLLSSKGTESSLTRCNFFGQDLEIHPAIEGFFASIKTTLDLLVQLLQAEDVVRVHVEGFNKARGDPGGRVLSILGSNAVAGKEPTCRRIAELIRDHKRRWIDRAIQVRDEFVHPPQGAQDLMFELHFALREGEVLLQDAAAPRIDGESIVVYAQDRLADLAQFSVAFLALLRAPKA